MKCDICGKEISNSYIKAYGKVLCSKHYQQILKFGHALDSNPRTTKDINDFIINNNVVVFSCYNASGNKSGEFTIDLNDLDKVAVKKWRIWKGRVFTGNYKPITLHRYIMDCVTEDCVVDHINGNQFDNRRCNLRKTSQANNRLNNALLKNNTSGFCGVSYNASRKKYEVDIRFHGKRYHLGRYNKLCDAVYARYVAEILLFGEYRSTRNDDNILNEIEYCCDKESIKKFIDGKLSLVNNARQR